MHVLTIISNSGCSIWAVELIKREILKAHPDANVSAVLIDFFLYDLAKEREAQGMFCPGSKQSLFHNATPCRALLVPGALRTQREGSAVIGSTSPVVKRWLMFGDTSCSQSAPPPHALPLVLSRR